MSERRVMPDIRQLALEDEDAENGLYAWDLIVRWLADQAAASEK